MITIDGYRIDATLTESHSFPSEATKYPRESGSAATDHVINNPIEVTIDGIVSDTPIGVIASARQNATAPTDADLEFLPSDEALAKLLAIRTAREPVTIETSLQSFDQMVMTALDIPVDPETGHALRFSATFQQAEIVTNVRTTVQIAKPVGKGNRPPTVVKFGPDGVGQITASTQSGRPLAWNPSKGRYEYANDAGQPGGTPVPNSDLVRTETVDSLHDASGQPIHFDHESGQWVHSDGSPQTKKLPDEPWW